MTILRTNLPYALPALAVMPVNTMAAPPSVHKHTAAIAIAIDCDHRYISQRDAARVLGTDNFSQTYAKRESLYATLNPVCSSGVDRVWLMADKPQLRTRALASR